MCGMPQRPGIRPQRTLDGTRLLVVCVCEAAEVGALKVWGQEGGSPSRSLAGGGETDNGDGRGVGWGHRATEGT